MSRKLVAEESIAVEGIVDSGGRDERAGENGDGDRERERARGE